MNQIHTRVRVGSDHKVTGTVPDDVPPGEHEAVMKRFRLADLPVHEAPWDGSISLRREDMYGDDRR